MEVSPLAGKPAEPEMLVNAPKLVTALTFALPDRQKFMCLDLAFEAGQIGGSMPAVLNAANEVAVDHFLEGRIGFLDIPMLIKKTMEAHRPFPIDSIEKVMEADRWARQAANGFTRGKPLADGGRQFD